MEGISIPKSNQISKHSPYFNMQYHILQSSPDSISCVIRYWISPERSYPGWDETHYHTPPNQDLQQGHLIMSAQRDLTLAEMRLITILLPIRTYNKDISSCQPREILPWLRWDSLPYSSQSGPTTRTSHHVHGAKRQLEILSQTDGSPIGYHSRPNAGASHLPQPQFILPVEVTNQSKTR